MPPVFLVRGAALRSPFPAAARGAVRRTRRSCRPSFLYGERPSDRHSLLPPGGRAAYQEKLPPVFLVRRAALRSPFPAAAQGAVRRTRRRKNARARQSTTRASCVVQWRSDQNTNSEAPRRVFTSSSTRFSSASVGATNVALKRTNAPASSHGTVLISFSVISH